MDRCNFEGSLDSDPQSKVNLVGCLGDGKEDISIMSSKVPLAASLYRKHKDGKIEMEDHTAFKEVGIDVPDQTVEVDEHYRDENGRFIILISFLLGFYKS